MAFRYSVRDTKLEPGQATTRIANIRSITAPITVAKLTSAGFSADDSATLLAAAVNTGSTDLDTQKDAIVNAFMPENELIFNSGTGGSAGSLNIRRVGTDGVSVVTGTINSAPFLQFRYTITNATQNTVPTAQNSNIDPTDDSLNGILSIGSPEFTSIFFNGIRLVLGRDWLIDSVTIDSTAREAIRFVELKSAFRPGGSTELPTENYPINYRDGAGAIATITHPTLGTTVPLTDIYDDEPASIGDIITIQTFNLVNPSVVQAVNVQGTFPNTVLVNDGQADITMTSSGATETYVTELGDTVDITTTPDDSVSADSINASSLTANKNYNIKVGASTSTVSYSDQTLTWTTPPASGSLATNTGYFVDTTVAAQRTVTMPSNTNVSAGDMIRFIDISGNFATNTFTISPSSAGAADEIQGDSTDFTSSTDRAAFALIYTGTTNAWVLLDK